MYKNTWLKHAKTTNQIWTIRWESSSPSLWSRTCRPCSWASVSMGRWVNMKRPSHWSQAREKPKGPTRMGEDPNRKANDLGLVGDIYIYNESCFGFVFHLVMLRIPMWQVTRRFLDRGGAGHCPVEIYNALLSAAWPRWWNGLTWRIRETCQYLAIYSLRHSAGPLAYCGLQVAEGFCEQNVIV